MQVRTVSTEDLDRLVELHVRMDAEEKVLGCVVIHPATRDFILEKILDPMTTFFVMEHAERIVAFAYGTLAGDLLTLQNVFVMPLWRRNGIARLLLTRLFSDGKALRARAYVLKGNIYESFWRSLGFQVTRELVNAFEMSLDLGRSRDVRKPAGQALRLVG